MLLTNKIVKMRNARKRLSSSTTSNWNSTVEPETLKTIINRSILSPKNYYSDYYTQKAYYIKYLPKHPKDGKEEKEQRRD